MSNPRNDRGPFGIPGSRNLQATLEKAAALSLAQGRLTIASGVPVADGNDQGFIYYAPYKGNQIGLFHRGRWRVFEFEEIKVYLNGDNGQYDLFAYWNGSKVAISGAPQPWASDTARDATSPVVLKDGVRVLGPNPELRFLGTFKTSNNSLTTDGPGKRYISNWTE